MWVVGVWCVVGMGGRCCELEFVGDCLAEIFKIYFLDVGRESLKTAIVEGASQDNVSTTMLESRLQNLISHQTSWRSLLRRTHQLLMKVQGSFPFQASVFVRMRQSPVRMRQSPSRMTMRWPSLRHSSMPEIKACSSAPME